MDSVNLSKNNQKEQKRKTLSGVHLIRTRSLMDDQVPRVVTSLIFTSTIPSYQTKHVRAVWRAVIREVRGRKVIKYLSLCLVCTNIKTVSPSDLKSLFHILVSYCCPWKINILINYSLLWWLLWKKINCQVLLLFISMLVIRDVSVGYSNEVSGL